MAPGFFFPSFTSCALVFSCLVFFFAHAAEVSDFVHVDPAKVVNFGYMAAGFFFFLHSPRVQLLSVFFCSCS
jgi:hypothetical protein